mmetsp:Transcript_18504/g.30165  ORF Transcript_18504/g.30165 Transcript_18504/m.30165 type:complete len:224 (-) Transcript_18504:1318-1989(-)
MSGIDEGAIEREFEAEYVDGNSPGVSEDVKLLTQALINEKGAPDILQYEKGVVDSIKAKMDEQQEMIDELREHSGKVFQITMYQMELDRIKYIVAEYLRTRLLKIQKFTLYILADAEVQGRLSAAELGFAKKFVDLEASHFANSALQRLPSAFRDIAEEEMITKPDMDKFVFCRVERELGEVEAYDAEHELLNRTVELNKGEVYAMRYRHISSFIPEGDISLI